MQHDASCHVTVSVRLLSPPGSTFWIPLPRRLRAAPRDWHPRPPSQRSPSGPRSVSRRESGGVHHRATAVTARRPRAGHTLQVPRALLRARLRLFRDRQLGRVAILSQFMKERGNQPKNVTTLSNFLRFFFFGPANSKTSDFPLTLHSNPPTLFIPFPYPFVSLRWKSALVLFDVVGSMKRFLEWLGEEEEGL